MRKSEWLALTEVLFSLLASYFASFAVLFAFALKVANAKESQGGTASLALQVGVVRR
jgi:hypothetical protein